MAEWWRNGNKIPLDNVNFQEILRFYLFECPITTESKVKGKKIKKHVSARGVTLEKQGWSGKTLNTLLAAMKRKASSGLKYIAVEASKDVKAIVKNEESISTQSDVEFEMIIFKENTTMGKTKSIFYMIRNALAHGSFSVVETDCGRVYYFQSDKDGDVKGQLRLKEKTLLEWIRLVQTPVGELRRKGKKERTSV